MTSPLRPLTFLLTLGIAAAAELDGALETNDLAAAEAELEALVADWETAWQKSRSAADAVESGRALQALGIIERQAGKADEALPHLQSAVERLATDTPAGQADALEALALTVQDLGQAAEAEKHLRQVIELRPEGAERLQGLDHLALTLLAQGKYAEAGGLFRQTLDATPAEDAESRARRLGQLGRYFHVLGSHAKAADTFREALALDVPNPELRLSLSSQLALSNLRLGKTEEARKEMEDAVQQASELYESAPFRIVPFLNNLGALDLSLGNAANARTSFAKAVELLEKSFGKDHPSLITPLNNLGSAEQAEGNYQNAETSLRRAAALQEKHLPKVHLQTAETARNLARNALLSGNPDAPAEIDRATSLGIAVLDDLIVHGSEQERLNFLQRHDLVSLPCATGDAPRIANVLLATKARLFDAMLAGGKAATVPGWQAVQKSLPPGTALVDACRFTATDDEEEHYGAIILLPEGSPKWVPLGSGEDLQRWLAAFRDRLAWRATSLAGKNTPPPALKLRGILRSLHQKFWEPIARELPEGTQHVAFSPDGALHFLPLPALMDEGMQPLCSRFLQVATLTSGRDLLNPPASTKLSGAPWELLGVSEFPKSTAPADGNRLLEMLAGLDDMPGTADEMDRLEKLAPRDSRFLRNDQANERALASITKAPAVLHLGCHAFFLADDLSPATALDFDERADLLHAGGLLLHGAALRKADSPLFAPDDDLLYPAEVAKLPLQGTRLVTLSSCESGAGTAVSGEGLLGLRRGFALAGAREVVVALWPVSDRSTPAFMERFYQLALASDRPAQALWQCQREFLTRTTSDDDFEAAVLRYAPFVLSQNTPLITGQEIVAAPTKPGLPWKRLALGLPLLLFLAARLFKRKAA
ncbi:CHAT domain-containing protein [Luteolibacter arcticus]|uniref:CHAT domain-containing protein n=1 Tax=Luteolibacter arcticus TaxID=1581411 RepID=A0ABT3GGX0_9BACT|nr:CHAT domain-containing tetratricopeptide repeat protein [Luteolibacter arcticus]MCW1922845.1 CHAT domain-containing protein [Luteolibacter arcticus]